MPNFKTVNVKQVSKSFEPESLSRTVTAFDKQCPVLDCWLLSQSYGTPLRPKSGSCSRTDKGVAHGAVMAAGNPAPDSFRTVQWHCLRGEITASSYKVWQWTSEGLLNGMQIIGLLKEQRFF